MRSRGTQLQVLDCLLWAALWRADRAELRKIIAKKVGSKSVTAAQRGALAGGGSGRGPRGLPLTVRRVHSGPGRGHAGSGGLPGVPTGASRSRTVTPTRRPSACSSGGSGAMFAPHEEWKEGIVDLPARAAATDARVHPYPRRTAGRRRGRGAGLAARGSGSRRLEGNAGAGAGPPAYREP